MNKVRLKMLLPIVLAVAALLAINAPVMAQPVTSPFSGEVTIDNEPAPDGSEVAAYVADEAEPRGTTTTKDGAYELMLIGTAADVGKPVSFKVKKADTDIWLDAITEPEDPKFASYDPQVVNLFAFTGPAPTIAFSPESFSFTAIEGREKPADQTLKIWNSGEEGSTLEWSVSSDATWLTLSPVSGSSTGVDDVSEVTVSVDITDMAANEYSATITISAEGATNSPQSVPVSLTISSAPITVTWNCPLDHQVLISPYPKNERPFLSTPADLSEVTMSISDGAWFQVYWLDEETGKYLYFISGFAKNTLLTLQPDEFYLVIVSVPCTLTIPQ